MSQAGRARFLVAFAGLSPETVSFSQGVMEKQVPYNILRPEVVESLFVLWRVTGDPTYQEWGWNIFSAFNNYSRVCPSDSPQPPQSNFLLRKLMRCCQQAATFQTACKHCGCL